jgi:hypothetical protein
MERKSVSSLLTLFVYFLSLLFSSPLVAQEKAPVFWTRGGNWGNWLKITAYPGLAIRTACGDDSTLKNHLVSSTDWQLRNGYTEPMAVVWRAQFFDDTIGKNKMGGWMLTHLKAGEVLDGWNVEGGHCQARNFISVQVKCAVREADVAKCYDADGNPYPPRPDGAFSGDHNPNGSGSDSHVKQAGKRAPALVSAYWVCVAVFRASWGANVKNNYYEGVVTNVFQKGVEADQLSTYGNKGIAVQTDVGEAYREQFGEWVKSTSRRDLSTIGADGSGYACYVFTTQQDAQKYLNEQTTPKPQYGTFRMDAVDWSPK